MKREKKIRDYYLKKFDDVNYYCNSVGCDISDFKYFIFDSDKDIKKTLGMTAKNLSKDDFIRRTSLPYEKTCFIIDATGLDDMGYDSYTIIFLKENNDMSYNMTFCTIINDMFIGATNINFNVSNFNPEKGTYSFEYTQSRTKLPEKLIAKNKKERDEIEVLVKGQSEFCASRSISLLALISGKKITKYNSRSKIKSKINKKRKKYTCDFSVISTSKNTSKHSDMLFGFEPVCGFWVRGHWRKFDGIGKDRGGERNTEGYTWIKEHTRLDHLGIVEKMKIVS